MSHGLECQDPAAVLRLGREMKDLIRSECCLTASLGIGSNKLLAKIARGSWIGRSDCWGWA